MKHESNNGAKALAQFVDTISSNTSAYQLSKGLKSIVSHGAFYDDKERGFYTESSHSFQNFIGLEDGIIVSLYREKPSFDHAVIYDLESETKTILMPHKHGFILEKTHLDEIYGLEEADIKADYFGHYDSKTAKIKLDHGRHNSEIKSKKKNSLKFMQANFAQNTVKSIRSALKLGRND